MAIKNYCLVCGGTGCEAGKADAIYHGLRSAAEINGIGEDVQIVKTGCFGLCEKGPIVKVLPEEAFYVNGTLGLGLNEYESARNSLGGVNRADYDGYQVISSFELGKAFHIINMQQMVRRVFFLKKLNRGMNMESA